MDAERANYSVKLLCRVMQISESGYYAWRARLLKPPRIRRPTAAYLVRNCFYENRRQYGSRRIAAAVHKAGTKIGRFQVRRLMREQNLRAIQPKKFVSRTTDLRGTIASPNLLRELNTGECARAKIIVGEITYLPLKNGKWCYLPVWQDKVTRRIIGWQLSLAMTAELVIEALAQGN